jgi:hypothetical protein
MEDRQQKERQALNALIRQAMPKVAAVVETHRQAMGAAHVTECQRRGMAGEPGWFYARQGVITIGAPWQDVWEIEAKLAAAGGYADAVMVVLRPVAAVEGGAGHGAH